MVMMTTMVAVMMMMMVAMTEVFYVFLDLFLVVFNSCNASECGLVIYLLVSLFFAQLWGNCANKGGDVVANSVHVLNQCVWL